MNKTLTIEYETFDDLGTKVMSVVDEKEDKVLTMFKGDEAEELYNKLITVVEDEEPKEKETMRELNTIQKVEKLNDVFAIDEAGNGGANHEYLIHSIGTDDCSAHIEFQNGARNEADSIHGVLDTDLLEIVRDRLKGFQSGEFACRENACALTHIEEALMWLNRRVMDRYERNVLGTNQK